MSVSRRRLAALPTGRYSFHEDAGPEGLPGVLKSRPPAGRQAGRNGTGTTPHFVAMDDRIGIGQPSSADATRPSREAKFTCRRNACEMSASSTCSRRFLLWPAASVEKIGFGDPPSPSNASTASADDNSLSRRAHDWGFGQTGCSQIQIALIVRRAMKLPSSVIHQHEIGRRRPEAFARIERMPCTDPVSNPAFQLFPERRPTFPFDIIAKSLQVRTSGAFATMG